MSEDMKAARIAAWSLYRVKPRIINSNEVWNQLVYTGIIILEYSTSMLWSQHNAFHKDKNLNVQDSSNQSCIFIINYQLHIIYGVSINLCYENVISAYKVSCYKLMYSPTISTIEAAHELRDLMAVNLSPTKILMWENVEEIDKSNTSCMKNGNRIGKHV
ncbi:predicted protein [Histoplasma capsulatum H143]|uniref:Uncharacterized protein n=1 Tax=Ajellomyces capsulatus (strain H143) TaxID=544712 RepID=C6H7M6_AJECH|nr:predicted protein [Histoplasma capsulatum H143]